MTVSLWFPAFIQDGSPCVIIMRATTREWLATTCFRGVSRQFSGNFTKWNDFHQMLNDKHILQMLLSHIQSVICRAGDFPDPNQRVEIMYPSEVGWSSTSRLIDQKDDTTNSWWSPDNEQFDNRLVEPFKLNRSSAALRIRPDRIDIKAPLTCALTIVYELRFEAGVGWVAVVHKVYPGEDFGALNGDVTRREGVIFFNFDHPGQPL